MRANCAFIALPPPILFTTPVHFQWGKLSPLTLYHHYFFRLSYTFPMVKNFTFNALPPPVFFSYSCTFSMNLYRLVTTVHFLHVLNKKMQLIFFIFAEHFRWETNLLLSLCNMCIFWKDRFMSIFLSGFR